MPLSDAEWEAHVAFVTQALDGQEPTVFTYKDELGIWEENRLVEQQSLLEELWMAGLDHFVRDANAIIAGGMAGAGKTTVLTESAGIDLSQYLNVDPDNIKRAMAARGMIPDVNGLSPMDASPLVHEEASDLAKRLAAMAYEEQVNLLWDITMNTAMSVRIRMEWLQTADYTSIDGIFVDVPLETGASRAMLRYRLDHEKYLDGDGHGGRFVPPGFIEDSKPLVGGTSTRNYDVFCEVRDEFDSTAEYDNSGTEALLRHVTGTRWRMSA